MTSHTGFSPGFEESLDSFFSELEEELNSSSSVNVQEPPGKAQRSESGAVPTSSHKSQSARPACAVVKARADTQISRANDRGDKDQNQPPNDGGGHGEVPQDARASSPDSPAQLSPTAADVESIASSVSVTSSNMLDRHEALLRAKELARRRRQLREAQAVHEAAQQEAQAVHEAARQQAEAEAVRRHTVARHEAEAVNRQLSAELEELELDAQIAELSSKMSSASERSYPTGLASAVSS